MREEVKAVVSSTLTEAMAVAPAVALTQVQGIVRKPVTRTSAARPTAASGAMSPKATSRACTWRVRSESAKWSICCTAMDMTEMLSGAAVMGVVGSTRRGTLTAVTAEVRSRPSASSAVARTSEDGVMRKPVTGEAPHPAARTRSVDAGEERSESDGMSGAMSPRATRRANTRPVRSESALRWNCCTVIVVSGKLKGRGDDRRGDRHGAVTADTVGGGANMNDITGDDGDAEAGDGRSSRQRRGMRERGEVAEGGASCHASRRCVLGMLASVELRRRHHEHEGRYRQRR